MTYTITDACCECGACEATCPKGAIKEGERHYEIDASICTGCGTCASLCTLYGETRIGHWGTR